MDSIRPQALSFQLALASLVSIFTLGAVCGVGVVSLRQQSRISSTALHGQMELLDNAGGLQELLYQKGFVANYMLSGDRDWLRQLDSSRQSFARWLSRAQADPGPSEARSILLQIVREYGENDAVRRQVIEAFEAGKREEALALIQRTNVHGQTLLALCQEYTRLGHSHAQRELALAERALGQRTTLLLLASIAGILASLTMGYLLARRIARPIYELQLQVASAVQKTRLSIARGKPGLEALGEHMAALLRKLEETDSEILAQRQRLIQSEKLSAIGEVSAKLAHEILNPLAGMKIAVQLLLRSAGAGTLQAAEVKETAGALDHEISRVDQLVRRLINYAKPLSPRLETCSIGQLFDSVTDAVRSEAQRTEVQLVREEEAELPPLEIDPLLLTQALVNLVANALQATPVQGRVRLVAMRCKHLGRDHVALRVIDEGSGIASENEAKLFHPFFTTKPKGHGLGLAITRNIVVEHGGYINASNRDDRTGAVFEVLLPLPR